jgi:hypothetical protein
MSTLDLSVVTIYLLLPNHTDFCNFEPVRTELSPYFNLRKSSSGPSKYTTSLTVLTSRQQKSWSGVVFFCDIGDLCFPIWAAICGCQVTRSVNSCRAALYSPISASSQLPLPDGTCAQSTWLTIKIHNKYIFCHDCYFACIENSHLIQWNQVF